MGALELYPIKNPNKLGYRCQEGDCTASAGIRRNAKFRVFLSGWPVLNDKCEPYMVCSVCAEKVKRTYADALVAA